MAFTSSSNRDRQVRRGRGGQLPVIPAKVCKLELRGVKGVSQIAPYCSTGMQVSCGMGEEGSHGDCSNNGMQVCRLSYYGKGALDYE